MNKDLLQIDLMIINFFTDPETEGFIDDLERQVALCELQTNPLYEE